MQVINWLELQPSPADLEALREHLQAALPLRNVCQLLVETNLRAYPWTGRADLIACYHPSQTYKQGQPIALPIADSQTVGRVVWLLGQVKQVRVAENRVQGRFQVLTLDLQGRQIQMAGGIPGASYPQPDLSGYTADDLAWLVEWVSNTYAASLQAAFKKLIGTGQIAGRLAGETFLPEPLSALSPELLHPCFASLSAARPWISLEEIFQGLPELAPLRRETILPLLHAALNEGPYRSLGAGRWTTPELFDHLHREVPLGLPTPRIRSKVSIWTKRDEQDLAGYGRKFMPVEAQRALEKLEASHKLLEPDHSHRRHPQGSWQLPALNYLHATQAYFPVGDVLQAFAPELQLVFVQFMNSDHQPFFLDREKGVLKAVHPEKLVAKILKDGIPAGTTLWLEPEYEGSDKFRIVPRPLPFRRMVSCKLAYLDKHCLRIEHTQISMMYEGDPSLFRADLRSEELEELFAEARRVKHSVREAIIYAIQELCATDPDHRAYWLDVVNTVFLQRPCSPSSVLFLLYTQPCFEQLGGGYFRHKPTPEVPMRNIRKRKDRLSQMWDHLLSDTVAPDPKVEESAFVGARVEGDDALIPIMVPDLELPSHLGEPEISVTERTYAVVEENALGTIALREEEHVETLVVSNYEGDRFTTSSEAAEPVSHAWKDSLERLLNSLTELEDHGRSALSVEEASSETEASSDVPVEAGPEESVTFSSPFRWEPKPAWVDVRVQPQMPYRSAANTGSRIYSSKIPFRPLHKQPFYRRFFFYLRGWLSRIFRKTA